MKMYIPQIILDDGRTAFLIEFYEYFDCWGVDERTHLIATEIYCDGIIEHADERLLSRVRNCFRSRVRNCVRPGAIAA